MSETNNKPAVHKFTKAENFKHFLISNSVPIIFLGLSAIAIPLSGFSAEYLIQEMITRLARNSFLVLSLLVPIMAGMGLNFGMVLGAMAGQIGLIFVTDWAVVGIPGLILASIISMPIAKPERRAARAAGRMSHGRRPHL